MGAGDRPSRQHKPPQLYQAGPASGRLQKNDSFQEDQLDGTELDATDSPPASAPQRFISPKGPAGVALVPTASSRTVTVSLATSFKCRARDHVTTDWVVLMQHSLMSIDQHAEYGGVALSMPWACADGMHGCCR